jgi:hypothetical protein
MPSKRFGGVTSSFHRASDIGIIATVIRVAAQELPRNFGRMELAYI